MHSAKSKWKILRVGVFAVLMALAWGFWWVCFLQPLYEPHHFGHQAKTDLYFVLLLLFMGRLFLWSFVIYWREPKLSMVAWLSLLAMILASFFVPIKGGV
jgi:hypothetical protein